MHLYAKLSYTTNFILLYNFCVIMCFSNSYFCSYVNTTSPYPININY